MHIRDCAVLRGQLWLVLEDVNALKTILFISVFFIRLENICSP